MKFRLVESLKLVEVKVSQAEESRYYVFKRVSKRVSKSKGGRQDKTRKEKRKKKINDYKPRYILFSLRYYIFYSLLPVAPTICSLPIALTLPISSSIDISLFISLLISNEKLPIGTYFLYCLEEGRG